jgi:hypothetical protein
MRFSLFNAKIFKGREEKNSITSLQDGFILSEAGCRKAFKTSFAIFTNDEATVIDHCWFRGGWWDPVTMAWNTVKKGEVKATSPVETDAPGASLFVPFNLPPAAENCSCPIRLVYAGF